MGPHFRDCKPFSRSPVDGFQLSSAAPILFFISHNIGAFAPAAFIFVVPGKVRKDVSRWYIRGRRTAPCHGCSRFSRQPPVLSRWVVVFTTGNNQCFLPFVVRVWVNTQTSRNKSTFKYVQHSLVVTSFSLSIAAVSYIRYHPLMPYYSADRLPCDQNSSVN